MKSSVGGSFSFSPLPSPAGGSVEHQQASAVRVVNRARVGGVQQGWLRSARHRPRREINVSRRGGLTIGQPPRNGLFHAVNNIAKKVPCQSGAKVTAAPSAAVPHAPHFLLRKKNVTRG